MKNRNWISTFCLVSLLALAGCSKDVPLLEHQGGPRARLMDDLAGLLNEDKEGTKVLSFDAAEDAKVMEQSRAERAYLQRLRKFRSVLDAELKVNQTRVLGIPVVSSDARAKLSRDEIYENTVLPLGGIVLNPNFLSNTNYTDSLEFRRLLTTFNAAFVALLQADPDFVKEQGLLRDYWHAVILRCRTDLGPALRECPTVSFFGSDHNTASILQFLAASHTEDLRRLGTVRDQLAEQLRQSSGEAGSSRAELEAALSRAANAFYARVVDYQRVVTIAMATSNRRIPAAGTVNRGERADLLDILYLNGAVAYANYLNTLPASQQIRRELQAHVDNVKTVIGDAPNRLNQPEFREALQEILERNNFWLEYSRRKQSEFSQWGGALFSLASDGRLREGSGINVAIRKSLLEHDASGDPGFLTQIREFESKAAGSIMHNLELDINFAPNEYLYITDQLFRRHWSVEDASVFWSGLTVNNIGLSEEERTARKRQLLLTVEKYMKFQIARMIVRTNSFMGRVFSNRENSVSSQIMFATAVEESERIGNEWKNMLAQIKDLETFTTRYAKEAVSSRELEEYRRLSAGFANLKKNISILAVYPNMLVLSFFMAKEQFFYPVKTWWGQTFELDAEIVINWLFAQITNNPPKPWFNFGNEDKAILKYENLYTVFFAMKTNVFQTIQEALNLVGKNIQISEKEFFKVLIDKFTNLDRNALRTYINGLEATYRRNADFDSTLVACAEEERFERELTEGNPNPRRARYAPMKLSLERIDSFTFAGKDFTSNDEISIFPVQAFFSGGLRNNHRITLQAVRVFLASSISFLNILLDLWEKHWDQVIASEVDPAKKEALVLRRTAEVEEVKSSFAEISELKRRTYSKVLELFHKSRNCFDTLHRVERRQQYKAYDLEIDHLLAVHARLKKLKEFEAQKPDESQGAQALQAWQAELVKLESELSQETRAQSYLRAPGDVLTFDSVSLAEGYRFSKWDMVLRFSNYIESINPNLIVARPDVSQVRELDLFKRGNNSEFTLSISYEEDATNFVNRALKNVSSRFLHWSKFHANVEPYKERLELMVELYRLRALQVFRDDFTTCAAPAQPGERAQCRTEMPSGEVGVDDLVNELFKLAKIMSIDMDTVIGRHNDTEASYMQRIGVSRKFPVNDMKHFFLEERSQRALPLFDQLFKVMLGSTPYLEEAKTAVQTLEAIRNVETENNGEGNASVRANEPGELLFLSDKDQVRVSTIEQYKPFVDGTFQSIQDLADAIRRRSEADRGKEQKFVFEIDLNANGAPLVSLQPELNSSGEPVYLANARLQDFESMQTRFHSDTKHRFRTNTSRGVRP